MITHPKDIEYFAQYPAPIMEQIHSLHHTNINSTITFFGPLMYFLIRSLGCEQVLEIGHAEGYTAFYMASAVRDNGVRFGMKNNRYYGIDIAQTDKVKEAMVQHGLKATILNMDSINLSSATFPAIDFDLIFQDGAHDAKHVVHEMMTLYPQLKGEGKGFWIYHDCYGPAEEGFTAIINDPRYNFEFVRIPEIYGIAIMRKMDGYDHKKKWWNQ